MVIQHYKKQKKIKIYISDVNEVIKERYKSKEQKNAMKNIITLYEPRGKVIKLLNDYSKIASKVNINQFMEKDSKY